MGVGERISVAVLLGGESAEHDVSVCSGLNVLDALDPQRFAGRPIYIDRSGEWHFDHRPVAPVLALAPGEVAAAPPPVARSSAAPPATGGAFECLRGADLDVVFVALHGPGGEDGTVQGMLSLAGIPYTGSGVLASALAMDKARTKRYLRPLGVPVPDDVLVQPRHGASASVNAAIERIGLPCVVKPVASGSSVGVRIARQPTDLSDALGSSSCEDEPLLVESYLEGVEVTCGVLGGGRESAQALPLTEIRPRDGQFFDFRAKYTADACREITPAEVEDQTAARVQELAVVAHEALGCEGMSRSDFILSAAGPMLLELNTIPGMTETSLLPQGAAAAGIPFAALIERLIHSALLRAGRVS